MVQPGGVAGSGWQACCLRARRAPSRARPCHTHLLPHRHRCAAPHLACPPALPLAPTPPPRQGLKCLYPPGGGPGAVEVTHLDLPRLDADEFLNDTVIDFYLRWVGGWAGVGVGWLRTRLACIGFLEGWGTHHAQHPAARCRWCKAPGTCAASPCLHPRPPARPPSKQVAAGPAAGGSARPLLLLQHLFLQEADGGVGWVGAWVGAARLVGAGRRWLCRRRACLRPLQCVTLHHTLAANSTSRNTHAGGKLTPELEVYAAENGFKGTKLQALLNHQKVKKWTKVGTGAGGGGAAALLWLGALAGQGCGWMPRPLAPPPATRPINVRPSTCAGRGPVLQGLHFCAGARRAALEPHGGVPPR